MSKTDFIVSGFELGCHDLEKMTVFYERSLRLNVLHKTAVTVSFGFPFQEALLTLYRTATPASSCSRRLDHLAFRVDSREVLGMFLHHLILTQTPILGAIDHGVSEAIYLEDPEHNRIEVTCDKENPEDPAPSSHHEQTHEPFDYAGVFYASSNLECPFAFPDSTVIGHVSLNVTDLNGQTAFYTEIMRLEVGYESKKTKIHIGNRANPHLLSLKPIKAKSCDTGQCRLVFTYQDCVVLQNVIKRLQDAGKPVSETESGYLTMDSEANLIHLRLAT